MEGLIPPYFQAHFFSLFTPLLESPSFFYVMCRSPFNILVKVFLNCWLANA